MSSVSPHSLISTRTNPWNKEKSLPHKSLIQPTQESMKAAAELLWWCSDVSRCGGVVGQVRLFPYKRNAGVKKWDV